MVDKRSIASRPLHGVCGFRVALSCMGLALLQVAEVAMCFTGDFLNPDEKIYTLDYFRDLCKKCANFSLV
eukprot:395032-Amphidinium_carterae.1